MKVDCGGGWWWWWWYGGLARILIWVSLESAIGFLYSQVSRLLTKANSELSSHQKKIFKVNDHIGVAIAALTADSRVLSRYMRSEAFNHSFTYKSPLPVGRLVVQLADKAQSIAWRSLLH
ncbi:hypothetical protein CMV_024483 [Castanea mollissima]|uniref:Uncharacterized protein n=1 Tax=Castanea mollissima TaxID=60419 RepID=A0A8J4V5T1_9ROSI|nr:hypothetical protein CMV_024483 [Castanea mollissima]